MSPDGATIAVGVDGGISLVNYPGCDQVSRLPAMLRFINDLCFSPDGTLIACSSEADPGVVIYSLDGADPIVLQNPMGVEGVCFTPDGKSLVAGCDDATIRIWDVARRQVRAELRGHDRKSVTCLCFSPTGDVMASGGDDGTARLWRASPRHERDALDHSPSIHRSRPQPDAVAHLRVPDRISPTPGEWNLAVTPLKERLARYPDDLLAAYQFAVLCRYLGRDDECRAAVAGILNHLDRTMSSTQLSEIGVHVALICAVDTSLSNEQLQRLSALLALHVNPPDQARTNGVANEPPHRTLLVRGWIEHRLGDNEASLATFDKLLKGQPKNRCLQILGQLGIAAAQRSGTDTVALARPSAATK
jgi:hypothetical protein